MKRILYEVSVSTLNERARLREHRLRLDVARHRLGIKAEDMPIRGRKDARLSEGADDLLPYDPSIVAKILRRSERSAFRDRLRIVDHARRRLAREDSECRRFRLRSSRSHRYLLGEKTSPHAGHVTE